MVEGTPEIYDHTAQIYNDFLYVLGGYDKKKGLGESNENPWRFDISKRILF